MEYDYEKMQGELKDITERMKKLDDLDKLCELRQQKEWLESKLKARDTLAEAQKK